MDRKMENVLFPVITMKIVVVTLVKLSLGTEKKARRGDSVNFFLTPCDR